MPCTYCHAFKRCCLNAVSIALVSTSSSGILCAHVCAHRTVLTRRPPALRLLRLFAVRVLTAYRVGMLDLLCARHDGGSARLGESIGGVKGSRRGREEWRERAGLRSAKPLSQISDRAAAPRLHACGAYASPPETLSPSRTYHGLVIATAAMRQFDSITTEIPVVA